MPVLDCTFQDPIHVWSGGLDNTLKCYDINSNHETALGTHENAIKCVEYSNELNVIVTGSWDGTVKVWDQRIHQNPCTGVYSQPDKVYTMSVAGDKLVVGTAGRKVAVVLVLNCETVTSVQVWVWDLRNMSCVQQKRESSLKYQTRSVDL